MHTMQLGTICRNTCICGCHVTPRIEVIRVQAGMSTARFCHLFDMPERTWRRWQAKARAVGEPVR
jgi:DNA-binding transcriptional regulator YiaG